MTYWYSIKGFCRPASPVVRGPHTQTNYYNGGRRGGRRVHASREARDSAKESAPAMAVVLDRGGSTDGVLVGYVTPTCARHHVYVPRNA